MTSRERVHRAITFRRPDRVPVHCPSVGVSDLHWVHYGTAQGWQPSAPGMDEWGCVWDLSTGDMGQPKGAPLANGYHAVSLPDPDAPGRFATLKEQLQSAGDRFVLADCTFTLFERMCALRGMSYLLQDFYLAPDKVHDLADRVLEVQMGFVRGYARHGGHRIDGVALSDDWGMQDRPFVSLETFREFFKPRYQRLFDFIHSAGWRVWFHTCGRVNDLLEEFIEMGCDVLDIEQPHVLGIEQISRRYAGRVCFAATCDIQRTLPLKTPEEVRQEARLLLHAWGTPTGGFIGVEYHAPDHLAIPVENLRAMGEVWLREDVSKAR
ncbi:MAG: hypothetical protein NZT92_21965 [Abditibacteriales bacterium]|nr:hypothetical protein [Abditibacteriales bacterium]MDW8367300.1 uroporphyrinogen decarboxylase family protein [Abditibacteriales bacterium]